MQSSPSNVHLTHEPLIMLEWTQIHAAPNAEEVILAWFVID